MEHYEESNLVAEASQLRDVIEYRWPQRRPVKESRPAAKAFDDSPYSTLPYARGLFAPEAQDHETPAWDQTETGYRSLRQSLRPVRDLPGLGCPNISRRLQRRCRGFL